MVIGRFSLTEIIRWILLYLPGSQDASGGMLTDFVLVCQLQTTVGDAFGDNCRGVLGALRFHSSSIAVTAVGVCGKYALSSFKIMSFVGNPHL